ncbi:MAG: tRNA epoxyqueuosine(34) reductase QueG [Acidimicrobiia bacterium]|nr:tRNA epoxyqueuosine(34) reductase QueG [Acidimicrobiia bacterium]
MEQLVVRLRAAADHAGLDGFGIASAEPFEAVGRTMHERKAGGLSGRLGFTYRDPDLATDVRRSFPWAKSLVVAASTYVPMAGSPGPPDGAGGRIARFATRDHYAPLRAGLGMLTELLAASGFRVEALVDDGRLVDRAAAVRAGVAWWGKSTMVISPKHGPWLLLGSIVTDADLPVSEAMRRDCGKCDACIPACPTGALIAPGVLDATRCIAYWAQTAGVIPVSLRRPWGDRIYGCDDCLDACPPGHNSLEQTVESERIDLTELLSADDEALLDFAGHWFIPKRDPDYIRRNALIALGNSGLPEHLPILARYLGHRRATLRCHAAWALGEMGEEARPALAARRAVEHDPAVLGEIDAALGNLD